MQHPVRPIAPLPARTASHLRSSINLPSLPSILSELIQNALDAHSTKIDCSLDLTRWTIACHDNGIGIPWHDLKRLGRERYFTSKLGGGEGAGGEGEIGVGEVGTYGFRGEAVASMADVGVVEVLTKPRGGSGDSYELVVSGGRTVSVAKAAKDRVGIGTSVWVRDIVANYPVRRRPLAASTAHPGLVASLRQAVTALALIHPNVSFSLTDASSDEPIRLLSVARSTDGVLGRWRQMWGRAGVEKVAPIEAAHPDGEMDLSGFFSLTASHSKGSQYIYVNSRPLSPGPLHKLVNSLFASSTFARHASSHLAALAFPTPSQHRAPPAPQPANPDPDATTPKRFRATPKKVTERHPIFVLMLELPPHLVDVTLEPEKRAVGFVEEERVVAFVGEVVRGWLVGQGLLAERRIEREPSVACESAREPLSDEELTPVKRVREGLAKYLSPHGPLSPRPRTPARDVDLMTARSTPAPALTPGTAGVASLKRPDAVQVGSEVVIDASGTDPVRWTDPLSGETLLIDPRSGNSWRVGERLGDATPKPVIGGLDGRRPAGAPPVGRSRLDRSRLRRDLPREGEEVPPPPEWMASALKDWTNPVFSTAPAPVPVLPTIECDDCRHSDGTSPPPGLPPWLYKAGVSRARAREMDAFFRHSTRVDAHHLLGDAAGQRVSKEGLAGARFIAQVDRKFLLVAVPEEAEDGAEGVGRGEALVMVDQHAADERVRVERIWEGVAGRVARGEEVERSVLEPPAGVVVSREELTVLRDGGKREQFARWGIDVVFQPEREDGHSSHGDVEEEQDYAQVWLRAVPKIVSGRLKVEPKLRQELVRSYLGEEYAVGRGGWVDGATAAAVLRKCPPVLVELMNSLACRGAVMFNDALSRRQCETLLRKLARTKFPFQCAHGRPTLQPVVNLPRTGPVRAWTRSLNWDALRDEAAGEGSVASS